MAEKITDKLNELDAGSVTPQEFQEVWGISKEEYLNRMMNHIHQRKAEAAEEAVHEGKEEHDELKEMKGQMAALKREVEQLRQEVKELKALLNEQPHWPSMPGMEYAKRLIASKSLEKPRQERPAEPHRRRLRAGVPHDVAGRELRDKPAPRARVVRQICCTRGILLL